jgi:hypothetical protein
MSGEDAPRPYLEDLIVPEIKTNKQYKQTNKTKNKRPRHYELVVGLHAGNEDRWFANQPRHESQPRNHHRKTCRLTTLRVLALPRMTEVYPGLHVEQAEQHIRSVANKGWGPAGRLAE